MTPAFDNYPEHIAIVMDGNGRWAKARKRPRVYGHQQGVEATRTIIETCAEKGVKALTLFAFSSENWKRPEEEVSFLMQLFIKALSKEAQKLHSNNVCLKVIGDVKLFDQKLQNTIIEVETLTQSNTGLKLFIAANYGGQWDIVQATRQIAEKSLSGEIQPEAINERLITQHLMLSDVPAVDLFIRTGGEVRLSNFLLWQIAYAELYFSETLWPDFNAEELKKAMGYYSNRERRFGKISEQLEENGMSKKPNLTGNLSC